jgi:phage protein U
MYAQLGNIEFQGLLGFSSFQQTFGAKYAELALLDGKARLQKTGTALEQVTFGIYFDRAFTIPEERIAELRAHLENGDILNLVNGAGDYLGRWVVMNVQVTHNKQAKDGTLIGATVNVTLKEFVDPNPEATRLLQLQSEAFALDPDKVVPVQLVRIGTTVQAITSIQVQAVESNSVEAIKLISRAESVPAEQPGLFKRAKFLMNQTIENAQSAIQNIQDAVNIAAVVPNLLSSLQAVESNAEFVKAAVNAGDLTNALSGSLLLTDSLSTMNDSVRPLDALIIARKPV